MRESINRLVDFDGEDVAAVVVGAHLRLLLEVVQHQLGRQV